MFSVKWQKDTLAMVVQPRGARIPKNIFQDPNLTFVWGYLMDPDFILKLLGRRIAFAPAVLKGYRRRAKGKSFILQKQKGGIVPGVVLIGLSSKDVAHLNEFEEVPEVMVRRRVEVYVGDRRTKTCIYMKK